jgi:predicted GNAT superfamily acetyltransferase
MSATRWGLDAAAVLALNTAEEIATAPLDLAALSHLLDQAVHAEGVEGGQAAFLIALDETAQYDNYNFRWLKAKLPRFVYIDRVVVAASHRGQGLARRLYTHLAGVARAAGHTVLVCEVNVEPPNPVSDAFHAALGFTELGRGTPKPGKVVRYLGLDLSSATSD